MAPKDDTAHSKNIYVEVDIKKLPSFSKLQQEVNKVIQESSLFEKYGSDWMYLIGPVLSVPVALTLLQHHNLLSWITATFMLGCMHNIIANRIGHVNIHGALSPYPVLNKLVSMFATEFVGSYSTYLGHRAHVKGHHPHTNIIGLGDSSMWKVPQLNRWLYLFIAPHTLPILAPVLSIAELVQDALWVELLKFLPVLISGLVFHVYLLTSVVGYTVWGALVYMVVYRSVFSTTFIHINIFQHIGLPMYSQKARPARIYQMSTGVLNLERNFVLDHVMGHALVNCHVEHHLFPCLTDYMCLKVKPLVRAFLTSHGLPYNEDSYTSRLALFWARYDELMVDAPPITHFVGIQ